VSLDSGSVCPSVHLSVVYHTRDPHLVQDIEMHFALTFLRPNFVVVSLGVDPKRVC